MWVIGVEGIIHVHACMPYEPEIVLLLSGKGSDHIITVVVQSTHNPKINSASQSSSLYTCTHVLGALQLINTFKVLSSEH